jgi:hypothetical protein
MESKNRIKSIINAIDRKIGAKAVNLSSAVKILCGGYSKATANEYTPITSEVGDVEVQSVNRIKTVLDNANQKTGYNDSTLTDAVQRLCDGYVEETPLYSFGAISDLHIQYETGLADFQRALTYLKDKVSFTCVCGDLVAYATAENMAQYKSYVDTYADSMPIYECAGNHETYDYINNVVTAKTLTGEMLNRWVNATGKENPNYSFEYQGDVFIFLSLKSESPNDLFVDGGLQWLAETLESNKNKRCFVFQHVQDPEDDISDPSHSYSNILNGTSGAEFLRLIKKYKNNTIWFHGHTHLTLKSDIYPVSEHLGYHSVHIPSLSSLRFYNEETNALENYYYDENNNKIWGSLLAEGYIVDVYKNKIIIKGINFASGTNKDIVELFADEAYVMEI